MNLMALIVMMLPATIRAVNLSDDSRFNYNDPAFWTMVHAFPEHYQTLQVTLESPAPEAAAEALRKDFTRRGNFPERVNGRTTFWTVDSDTNVVVHHLEKFGKVMLIVHQGNLPPGADELYFKRDWLKKESITSASTLRQAGSIDAVVGIEIDTLDRLISRYEGASRWGLEVMNVAPGETFGKAVPASPTSSAAGPKNGVQIPRRSAVGIPMPANLESYWARNFVWPPCYAAASKYIRVTVEGTSGEDEIVDALKRRGAIANPPSCGQVLGPLSFWLEESQISALQGELNRTTQLSGWVVLDLPGVAAAGANNAEKQRFLSGELTRFGEELKSAPHIGAFIRAEINRLGGGGVGETLTRGRIPVVVQRLPDAAR